MSATTVNGFPPLHAFNSSRSWFMALIVLLHVGFFYGLTHGVTFGIIKTGHTTWVVDVPVKWVDPQPQVPPEPTNLSGTVDPVPLPRELDYRERTEDAAPQVGPRTEPTPTGAGSAIPVPEPVVVGPQLDARYPFTEPPYPTSEVRLGHEGTVLLRVQILPTGRVGAVELARSSGFPKLDEAAMREARMWRMKPGTHGGAATAMWTVVPIKFQLKN
ncbi:MAG TPA: energy transducer TonB [Steroidobacteraceae bacterium]|jgi:TonB family C-terminal domain|nr:energy transducer TonB [Steroidobacteraceae bacterium]